MAQPTKHIRSNWTYHLVIWLILILPQGFSSIYIASRSWSLYTLNVTVQSGMILFILYLNFLFLIPRFYKTRRYWTYIGFAIPLLGLYILSNYLLGIHVIKIIEPEYRMSWFGYVFAFFDYSRNVLIAFLLYNLQEKTEQQQKMDEIQVEKLKTEVDYLRAQINPHFLFNTLNNIYALSLEKSDKTPEIIMRLSKMMDYMLYESDELLVPLKNEVENLDNYVTIERLRQGNNGKINYTVKGEINDQRIVPLIFLPLIENGFKHGINQIIRAAFLDINLSISKDHIELSVTNNFRPEAVTNRERSGIGLQNLTKRLELFYHGKYKLEVKQEMGIYDVHLNISLK